MLNAAISSLTQQIFYSAISTMTCGAIRHHQMHSLIGNELQQIYVSTLKMRASVAATTGTQEDPTIERVADTVGERSKARVCG
jgi:hypothetical protein